MERDKYVPAEAFPEPCGQVNMIHKTSFSKREIKKFSREVKYAEVAMVDTPDFIDWSEQSISFDRTDHPKAVPRQGHAALVLEAQIGGYNMSKVFMDGGSGLNLLFANTMKAMGLTVDMLRESDTGFHGIIPTRPAYSLGKTSLDVVFGTPSNFRKEKIEFEVVDWESQYHAILGRPAFAKFMAVPHYAYVKLKMPGNNETPVTVHGSFARSDTCDREFQKIASKFGAKEELNAIDATTDHTQPPADNRNEGALIEFLRERWEIFAWEPSDMPGIPRELAEHALNVDPIAKPVQQSMRRFSEPKRRSIGKEVDRLRKAGFIRELKEAEWVANPVMVPKKDTTALRMCIDYTGLNKHYQKDHFSLPRIDQIVDSTAGCDRLSFLDAYSGYNQIKLKKEDQELTAFITPHGVFCYNVMTFGLKNAGATYQRCMQACLAEQIGRNIEVYIDDIVVKTKHAATLIDDLRETFDNLDKYKIKMNPKKCFFGVPGGQVLGYFISARGIEANPLKIKAILDMEPPKNLHQVQQLAGRLAALSRFIAKLGEKALPFYNSMKKSEKFEWTQEVQESFDNLKKILSTSPGLVTPRRRREEQGRKKKEEEKEKKEEEKRREWRLEPPGPPWPEPPGCQAGHHVGRSLQGALAPPWPVPPPGEATTRKGPGPVLPASLGRYYRPALGATSSLGRGKEGEAGTSGHGTGQGTAGGTRPPVHATCAPRYLGWSLRPRYRSEVQVPWILWFELDVFPERESVCVHVRKKEQLTSGTSGWSLHPCTSGTSGWRLHPPLPLLLPQAGHHHRVRPTIANHHHSSPQPASTATPLHHRQTPPPPLITGKHRHPPKPSGNTAAAPRPPPPPPRAHRYRHRHTTGKHRRYPTTTAAAESSPIPPSAYHRQTPPLPHHHRRRELTDTAIGIPPANTAATPPPPPPPRAHRYHHRHTTAIGAKLF
ncbi:hypothetical protein QYE76_023218 [Lolium multiflorum]|uniref:Reverse transcriptase domain-containing protein n=1 Tax=Lolium multiflorum TaxID=4521 RepID=A0AAD8RBA4_LOLMU|nr:hypothetical protein QYE76_023218 [Lolium multiflorum]